MNKIAIPALSAVVAAGVTALVWTSVIPAVSAEELTALRSENARLTQATTADAPPASLTSVASEFATHAVAIAQAMAERKAARSSPAIAGSGADQSAPGTSEVTPRGHRNRGNATAHDAALSFAWAGDISDPDELGRLVYFESAERKKALATWATMPDAVRTQYPTPEAFYGLLLAASTLVSPPPGADLIETFMVEVELRPGRVAARRKGDDRNIHEYQLTDAGWKYVLPMAGVDHLPDNLNSETLARLVQK